MGFLIPGSQVRTLQGVQLKRKSMVVRDNTALEDIELLYPEVMAPDAKEKLIRLFDEIQADKNNLSDVCEAAEAIRKRIAQHEKEWESFQSLINPIYKTREKEEIKAFKQKISYIECVGQLTSVRINIARDIAGNDVSPDLAEVMRSTKGSDEADSAVQKIGIITDCVMDAMTMADYKRKHWTVENSLHYILDDTYDEDHSTIRRAKTGMTVVRKIAYNIIRLLMLKTGIKKFREVYDEVTADWEIATDYIFKPVPAI